LTRKSKNRTRDWLFISLGLLATLRRVCYSFLVYVEISQPFSTLLQINCRYVTQHIQNLLRKFESEIESGNLHVSLLIKDIFLLMYDIKINI